MQMNIESKDASFFFKDFYFLEISVDVLIQNKIYYKFYTRNHFPQTRHASPVRKKALNENDSGISYFLSSSKPLPAVLLISQLL